MRISFLLFLLSGIFTGLSAQEDPHYFEWDVLRFGIVGAPSVKGGLSLGTGLRYNLSRQYALDAQLDFTMMVGKSSTSTSPIISFPNLEGAYTFMVGGERYFPTRNKFRFFTGAGIGFYGGTELEIPDLKNRLAGSMAISPRIGVEGYRIRATLQYDFTTHSRASDLIRFTTAFIIWGHHDRLPPF